MSAPDCYEHFCDAVCRRVRWPFARYDIREELTAHLEDRAAALLAGGAEETDAQARAVAAMGDPDALGRALDKVHHPLWGWLSLMSGLLALVMAVMLLTSSAWDRTAFSVSSALGRGKEFDEFRDVEAVYWSLDRRTRFDGRSVHWTGAYLLQAGYGELPIFVLAWDYDSLNPFLEVRPLPEEGFTAVDDLGNTYELDLRGGGRSRVSSNPLTSYRVFNQRLWVLDVDPRAEWVRVTYDYYGRSFSEAFRLEWEGMPS